ncbi:MAG: membrane protein insertion efficiency factor YidD, partial [Flavobacteriales bacterium]
MRFVFIALVRLYQTILSPFLGSNCRHNPTCSTYAIQSFEEWGS